MGLVPNRIIVPNNLYPFVGIQMTLHHRPEFPEDMEKNPRQIYPIYLVVHPTNRKWVITPFITGISRVSPLITRVITHLLSGMSQQVSISRLCNFIPSTGGPVQLPYRRAVARCALPRCALRAWLIELQSVLVTLFPTSEQVPMHLGCWANERRDATNMFHQFSESGEILVESKPGASESFLIWGYYNLKTWDDVGK